MPTMTEDRTREFRLRRQADQLGLRLAKSRGKRWAHKPWSVSKLGTGEFVLGTHQGGKSLDEVESYLNAPVP